MSTIFQTIGEMQGELDYLQWLISCDPKDIKNLASVLESTSIEDKKHAIKEIHKNICDKDMESLFLYKLRCYLEMMPVHMISANIGIRFYPEHTQLISTRKIEYKGVIFTTNPDIFPASIGSPNSDGQHDLVETSFMCEVRTSGIGSIQKVYQHMVEDVIAQLPNISPLTKEQAAEFFTLEEIDSQIFLIPQTFYTLLKEIGKDPSNLQHQILMSIFQASKKHVEIGEEFPMHLYNYLQSNLEYFTDVYLDSTGLALSFKMQTKKGDIFDTDFIATKSVDGTLIRTGENCKVYERSQLVKQCME